jgi:hypothetical protein
MVTINNGMIYKEAEYNDELEPGDFVVYTTQNNLYYGFYKGMGNGTIQVIDPRSIIWASKNGGKPRLEVVFGQSKNWRVIRSHPDFVTKNRQALEEALEIIRETKILPVKY